MICEKRPQERGVSLQLRCATFFFLGQSPKLKRTAYADEETQDTSGRVVPLRSVFQGKPMVGVKTTAVGRTRVRYLTTCGAARLDLVLAMVTPVIPPACGFHRVNSRLSRFVAGSQYQLTYRVQVVFMREAHQRCTHCNHTRPSSFFTSSWANFPVERSLSFPRVPSLAAGLPRLQGPPANRVRARQVPDP